MTPDTEPPEEETSRRMDEEVLCIQKILRMLNDLDDAARARVITYLSSRFREKQ